MASPIPSPPPTPTITAPPAQDPSLPPFSRSSPPPHPRALLLRLIPSLPHTSRFLNHLSSHLSSTTTLDTSLLTFCYTIRLLLSFLPDTPPSNIRLTRLMTSLRPLAALLEDLRVRLRLVALIPIIASAFRLHRTPPKDTLNNTIAWVQVLSLAIFQAAENGAYLAEQGVLGWEKKKTERWWIWSSRAWALWTGLELGRLGIEWKRRKDAKEAAKVIEGAAASTLSSANNEAPFSGNEENRGKWQALIERDGKPDIAEKSEALAIQASAFRERVEAEREWERCWKRDFGINAAYFPMTLHYSLEKPLLAERSLAAIGFAVAWLSLGDAWRGSGN